MLKEMVVSAVVEEGDKVPVVEGNSKVETILGKPREGEGKKVAALRLLLIEAGRHALTTEELRGLLGDLGVQDNVKGEVCRWWEEKGAKSALVAHLSKIGTRQKQVQRVTWRLEAVPGPRILIYTITIKLTDPARAPITFTCSPQDLHDLLTTLKSVLHRCRGLADDL